MAQRNLLHVNQIEAFKEYLDGNQIPWRPGVGEFEEMQVRIENKWVAIYRRLDTNAGNPLVHLTVWDGVIPIVHRFLRYKRAKDKKNSVEVSSKS